METTSPIKTDSTSSKKRKPRVSYSDTVSNAATCVDQDPEEGRVDKHDKISEDNDDDDEEDDKSVDILSARFSSWTLMDVARMEATMRLQSTDGVSHRVDRDVFRAVDSHTPAKQTPVLNAKRASVLKVANAPMPDGPSVCSLHIRPNVNNNSINAEPRTAKKQNVC